MQGQCAHSLLGHFLSMAYGDGFHAALAVLVHLTAMMHHWLDLRESTVRPSKISDDGAILLKATGLQALPTELGALSRLQLLTADSNQIAAVPSAIMKQCHVPDDPDAAREPCHS